MRAGLEGQNKLDNKTHYLWQLFTLLAVVSSKKERKTFLTIKDEISWSDGLTLKFQSYDFSLGNTILMYNFTYLYSHRII